MIRAIDCVSTKTRFIVRFMSDKGPSQHTFYEKGGAREFARGKKWFGKAARVEEVKR